MDRERRCVPLDAGGVEARADGIAGSASVTASVADIGEFTEEIRAGAFDGVIGGDDVVGLFNHDSNFVLGRSGSTMTLRADDDGLHYEIPKMPAARSDVLEAIQRGDVRGNSFSFSVAEDEWQTRDGRPHRIIKRVGKLYDVGPVTFPAYEDTEVSARSLDKARSMKEGNDKREDMTVLLDSLERMGGQLRELSDLAAALGRRLELLESELDGGG